MLIDGKHQRTIRVAEDGRTVRIIDQRCCRTSCAWSTCATLEAAAQAIETMQVRGAPLIGATAAYGMCLALRADASDDGLERAHATRCSGPGPPRSTCAGRSTGCARAARAAGRAARRRSPMPRPPRSATRTCDLPRDRRAGPAADPAASPPGSAGRAGQHPDPLQRRLARHRSTGARPRRRSTWPRRRASRSMSGSTRRARATRAPRSPRSSCCSRACRTP